MSTRTSNLFHHRWAVPVLAELRRQRGSRFVTLANRLGVGRDSLARTLSGLMDAALVERNPGYGHPLRPEYVLSSEGERVAGVCERLLSQLEGLRDVALRKWSLPTIGALGGGPLRFSELRSELDGVTARSLTLALKELQAAGLVERLVTDDYPPGTIYRLTERARPLARVLRALARRSET
jgi:DNA-binding HxlR family transcriptional regulator